MKIRFIDEPPEVSSVQNLNAAEEYSFDDEETNK